MWYRSLITSLVVILIAAIVIYSRIDLTLNLLYITYVNSKNHSISVQQNETVYLNYFNKYNKKCDISIFVYKSKSGYEEPNYSNLNCILAGFTSGQYLNPKHPYSLEINRYYTDPSPNYNDVDILFSHNTYIAIYNTDIKNIVENKLIKRITTLQDSEFSVIREFRIVGMKTEMSTIIEPADLSFRDHLFLVTFLPKTIFIDEKQKVVNFELIGENNPEAHIKVAQPIIIQEKLLPRYRHTILLHFRHPLPQDNHGGYSVTYIKPPLLYLSKNDQSIVLSYNYSLKVAKESFPTPLICTNKAQLYHSYTGRLSSVVIPLPCANKLDIVWVFPLTLLIVLSLSIVLLWKNTTAKV